MFGGQRSRVFFGGVRGFHSNNLVDNARLSQSIKKGLSDL